MSVRLIIIFIFNTFILAPSAFCILPHEIQGSYNIHAPVHEGLTFRSLKKAGYLDAGEEDYQALSSCSYWEVIRGTIWNDDPEGLLFGGKIPWRTSKNSSAYSHGLKWGWKFFWAKRAAKNKQPTPANLTARTHFGNLQFLHAMASENGIKAHITKQELMVWLQFAYEVSTGRISPATKLADTEVASLRLGKTNQSTVAELFRVTGREQSSRRDYNPVTITCDRALGSMLHLIQDSYAEGHVERLDARNDAGFRKIGRFFCYKDQDGKMHGKPDKSPGIYEDEIIQACSILIKMAKEKEEWRDASEHLDHVFNLADRNASSGAGKFIAKAPRAAR